jgi:hypothetical protein
MATDAPDKSDLERLNVILVDYENVQTLDYSKLKGHNVQVLLFLGPHQKNIPYDLFHGACNDGVKTEVHNIPVAGRNALDMVLAHYTGRVRAQNPGCFIHILSRDTGYDPLITHMRSLDELCARIDQFADLGFLKNWRTAPFEDRLNKAIERLQGMTKARPGKVKSLISTLSVLYRKQLDEPALTRVYKALVKKGIVSADEKGALTYCIDTERGKLKSEKREPSFQPL